MLDAPYEELLDIPGMGPVAAAFFKMLPQAFRCYEMDRESNRARMYDYREMARYLMKQYVGLSREVVVLMLLDSSNRILYCDIVSEGTAVTANIYVQKIVGLAARYQAVYAVLSHNHPSGSALPSPQDLSITSRIFDALRDIDVLLIDHIIVAGRNFTSLKELVEGLLQGDKEQTLLGVTGSGKTFTMANVIERVNRPTLVLAHNKTLAAQLCSEFREFFPENAVEYFVSYYDYYQPEAYIATTDTYIEKDSAINDEIDKLRHSATSALSERRDVIIVASVSCIYSLGDPIDYRTMVISLRPGMQKSRDDLLRKLVEIQYERHQFHSQQVSCAGGCRGDFPSTIERYGHSCGIFWG